jgi:uncharacterized protein (DUF427 family)
MTTRIARTEPGPGQESVWDYPRPPRIEPTGRHVRVVVDGVVVAETTRALRVLETASPPTFYIPPDDVRLDLLEPESRHTTCEWKREADYWAVRFGEHVVASVGWSYPRPTPAFEAIRDHVAFYAGRVDEAWVDDERVVPQPGDFYGGWVTSEIVGPFKGEPGTLGW